MTTAIRSNVANTLYSRGDRKDKKVNTCVVGMSKNWNKIWRTVHLGLGIMLVVYHSRIAYVEYGWIDTAWSSDIDKFVSTSFVFMVMWTGLAKWPIYPWYKKRQNRIKREMKASAAE